MGDPKIKLREVFVLREVKIDAKKLRKGDVFRFEPLNKSDIAISPNEYFYAQAKPRPLDEPPGNIEIDCKVLIPAKQGKGLNFKMRGK